MNVSYVSEIFAQKLAGKLNYTEEQADILRYGFEVIIGVVLKIFILLSLAYLLNLFPHVLVVLLTSGIYRLLSGGVHCTTYSRCLIFGLIMFLSMGKIAQELPLVELPMLIIIWIFVAITAFLVSLKWAPAETENKPLSDSEKLNFKKLTLMWNIIWFVLAGTCILIFPLKLIETLLYASMLAHIIQAHSLTPLGYRVVGSIDRFMGKVTW